MNKFNELKALILEAEIDMDKFANAGNKAAGTRVRKAMQEIKVSAQELRMDIQNKKNA